MDLEDVCTDQKTPQQHSQRDVLPWVNTLLLSAKPCKGTDKEQFAETLNTAHIHIVHVALKEQAVR
jgi:hypothetical protein